MQPRCNYNFKLKKKEALILFLLLSLNVYYANFSFPNLFQSPFADPSRVPPPPPPFSAPRFRKIMYSVFLAASQSSLPCHRYRKFFSLSIPSPVFHFQLIALENNRFPSNLLRVRAQRCQCNALVQRTFDFVTCRFELGTLLIWHRFLI